jgi:hypothetical protein
MYVGLCTKHQDLVYNHTIIRRISRAISKAMQLLLPQQKQKRKASELRKQDKAAEPTILLLRSLTLFVAAWTASATSEREDADGLQVALQVAESGV